MLAPNEAEQKRTACVQKIVLELDARLRGHDTAVLVELAANSILLT